MMVDCLLWKTMDLCINLFKFKAYELKNRIKNRIRNTFEML